MLKAIETVYDGYRFRSRLEARWAVFFKTLGVKYEYEKEGYDLDGLYYLPDFWLPEQDVFIEVKGKMPTEDEWDKLQRLALYTGKDALFASGNCWLPKEGGAAFMGAEGANIVADFHNGSTVKLDLSRELVVVYREIWRYGIRVGISVPRKQKQMGNGFFVNTTEWLMGSTFDSMLQEIEKQHKDLKQLFAVLTQHVDEFFALIPPHLSGLFFEMEGGGSIVDAEWRKCTGCNKLNLSEDCYCNSCGGVCEIDEDRLIAAYTAARQARFEHGERG